MLKKRYARKIMVSMAVLFAVLLVYLVPKDSFYTLSDLDKDVVYVDKNITTTPIYLFDKKQMLARTKVATLNTDPEKKVKELLDILIQDGEGENKIPSGFKAVLPSGTKIVSLKLENNLLKVEFSKELLNVSAELEEKMIEAIVYTVTSVEEVKQVILYVDGDVLTYLPQSKKHLPSTLDRTFGINKVYDLQSFKDVESVTIYYVGKYNEDYYYVPVTKYMNDKREKIKIIIDELTTAPTYQSNLMSFLNSNTKLLSSVQDIDSMSLLFNDYIFNNLDEKNILEEVIYSISLSIADNYDVREVVFEVNNQEIYKSVLKTLE